jgi:hypothetical protein
MLKSKFKYKLKKNNKNKTIFKKLFFKNFFSHFQKIQFPSVYLQTSKYFYFLNFFMMFFKAYKFHKKKFCFKHIFSFNLSIKINCFFKKYYFFFYYYLLRKIFNEQFKHSIILFIFNFFFIPIKIIDNKKSIKDLLFFKKPQKLTNNKFLFVLIIKQKIFLKNKNFSIFKKKKFYIIYLDFYLNFFLVKKSISFVQFLNFQRKKIILSQKFNKTSKKNCFFLKYNYLNYICVFNFFLKKKFLILKISNKHIFLKKKNKIFVFLFKLKSKKEKKKKIFKNRTFLLQKFKESIFLDVICTSQKFFSKYMGFYLNTNYFQVNKIKYLVKNFQKNYLNINKIFFKNFKKRKLEHIDEITFFFLKNDINFFLDKPKENFLKNNLTERLYITFFQYYLTKLVFKQSFFFKFITQKEIDHNLLGSAITFSSKISCKIFIVILNLIFKIFQISLKTMAIDIFFIFFRIIKNNLGIINALKKNSFFFFLFYLLNKKKNFYFKILKMYKQLLN